MLQLYFKKSQISEKGLKNTSIGLFSSI